jgi:hypothetical protein
MISTIQSIVEKRIERGNAALAGENLDPMPVSICISPDPGVPLPCQHSDRA